MSLPHSDSALTLTPYPEHLKQLPSQGKYIIGQQTATDIVVYQAYHPTIAAYAVKNQQLGGPAFSFNRMSWIKPNFLWMMYRCGWASKQNQERVLAIWVNKAFLEAILRQGVLSSFKPQVYESQAHWQAQLKQKPVRLQWDPDHNPYGAKQERKAIQLGLKGEWLRRFAQEAPTRIEDITDFVKAQKAQVDRRALDELWVPGETIFPIEDPALQRQIGMDS